MSRVANESLPVGVQASIKRLQASNAKFGDLSELKKMPNRNVEETTWREGDSFIVPSRDVLETTLFVQDIAGSDNKAAGVIIETTAGSVKTLYLSTLRKSAAEYGDDVQPTGNIVESDTDFHKEVMSCPTQEDVFNLLASKEGQTVRVVKTVSVKTARYTAGAITGTRNTTVPYFTVG